MPATQPEPDSLVSALIKGLVDDDQHGSMPGILILLTFVAGDVDAFAILRLDHVFVANITGNVIFIGLALLGARGFSLIAPFIVAACFLLGAAGGGVVAREIAHRGRRVYIATLIQLIALALCTGLLAGFTHLGAGARGVVLALLALGMGAKSAIVGTLSVKGLTTSVITTTLAGVVVEGVTGNWRDPAFVVRVSAAGALFLGAVAGALFAIETFTWCPLAFATAVLCGTAWWARRAAHSSSSWAGPAS